MSINQTDLEKIYSRVDKSGACWIWLGGTDKNGYGLFRLQGKTVRVTRAVWKLHNKAPLRESQHVLHHCDNPRCVNPDHLFVGTHAQNMADMADKHRAYKPAGTLNPTALLNYAKAQEIREESAKGVTQGILATRYGVSRGAIYHILAGRTWQ